MEASKAPPGGQTTTAASTRRGIAKAAGVMSALTLASRVAGLARDVVVGGVFGASPDVQAELMLHPNFREAYEAFRDKRDARFTE